MLKPGVETPEVTPVVEVEHVSKHYYVRGRVGGSLRAVDDVTFAIIPGETFAVVGETGSGKSTLGRLVLFLEEPSAGAVRFEGRDLGTLSVKELRSLRREMQPVSQDPYSALNSRMTVRQILAEPFLIHKVVEGKALEQKLVDLLELVGMPASSLDRYPHEFSGGQRQRLVIARAISLRPKFVVCDEPLSALDVSVQSQIINLLVRLQRELGLTYLFISHDMSVVRYIADRVCVMYLGKQVEVAATAALFARPLHPYTQALLGAIPVSDPDQRQVRKRFRTLSKGETEARNQFGRAAGCVYVARCPCAVERCRVEVPGLREVDLGHWVACHLAPLEVSSADGNALSGSLG